MTARTPLFVVAALLLVGAGCATQINGGVYDEDGGARSSGDLARAADLASAPVDLAVLVADLSTPQKRCGDVVRCALQCGGNLGPCQLQCFQGASPKAVQEAGALLGCAAQKCLLSDGGGGNPLVCIALQCSQQVSMCEGLGFGGN